MKDHITHSIADALVRTCAAHTMPTAMHRLGPTHLLASCRRAAEALRHAKKLLHDIVHSLKLLGLRCGVHCGALPLAGVEHCRHTGGRAWERPVWV